jgi:hypothetical protein
MFFTALFVGLATGVRMSYAAMIPVYCLVIAIQTWKNFGRMARQMAVFCAGIGVALLPVFALFIAAPRGFIYGNFTYIRLNTLYRNTVDFENAMSLADKWRYFADNILSNPADFLFYTFLLLSIGSLGWLIARAELNGEDQRLLPAGLSLAMFSSAFAATPIWIQYFFAPLFFGFLLIAGNITRLYPQRRGLAMGMIVSFLATALLPIRGSDWLTPIAGLTQPSTWTTRRVQSIASKLSAQVQSGHILTLGPIFPLEAGSAIYPAFATGPFSWRTSIFVSPSRREQVGAVAPEDLELYLTATPPDAILVGFERNDSGFERFDVGGLEKPFEEYAQKYGYQFVELPNEFDEEPLHLWVRR